MESIPAHIAQRVTAVCYRRSDAGVKLLLVRSSAGRWTLSKGGVEKGGLQADAAAREAREEAGVRGRLSTVPVSTFRHRKFKRSCARTLEFDVPIYHLEVEEEGAAHEPHRDPTWFAWSEGMEALARACPHRNARSIQRALDKALAEIEP